MFPRSGGDASDLGLSRGFWRLSFLLQRRRCQSWPPKKGNASPGRQGRLVHRLVLPMGRLRDLQPQTPPNRKEQSLDSWTRRSENEQATCSPCPALGHSWGSQRAAPPHPGNGCRGLAFQGVPRWRGQVPGHRPWAGVVSLRGKGTALPHTETPAETANNSDASRVS